MGDCRTVCTLPYFRGGRGRQAAYKVCSCPRIRGEDGGEWQEERYRLREWWFPRYHGWGSWSLRLRLHKEISMSDWFCRLEAPTFLQLAVVTRLLHKIEDFLGKSWVCDRPGGGVILFFRHFNRGPRRVKVWKVSRVTERVAGRVPCVGSPWSATRSWYFGKILEFAWNLQKIKKVCYARTLGYLNLNLRNQR